MMMMTNHSMMIERLIFQYVDIFHPLVLLIFFSLLRETFPSYYYPRRRFHEKLLKTSSFVQLTALTSWHRQTIRILNDRESFEDVLVLVLVDFLEER